MKRLLTNIEKAQKATTLAAAAIKAVQDLKRFQREYDARKLLLDTRTLFNPTQAGLLTDFVLNDRL